MKFKFKFKKEETIESLQKELKFLRQYQIFMYGMAAFSMLLFAWNKIAEFIVIAALAFGVTTMFHMNEHIDMEKIVKLKEESK